jgi:polar amino acid transport system ATP-binding protein
VTDLVDNSADRNRESVEPPAAVVIRSVCKRFGNLEVLNDVSLSIPRQDVVCVIGPSGAGKSTLIRCINHLVPIDSGQILVNGHPIGYCERRGRLVEDRDRNIAKQRAEVGMVFQRFNLFPHLTALQNVSIGLVRVRQLPKRQAAEAAQDLLRRVGLFDKRHAYPNQLSGGQQQRVAIARSLAMRPSVMLFDEPTSALDPETIGEVLTVMRELADSGMTMVVVTHEIGFAREVADRIVVMDHGAIIDIAEPHDLFSDSRHDRTRAFLSKIV